MTLPDQILPQDVRQLIDAGTPIVLLDVREPEELAIVHLDGALHIPMAEIPGRLHELDPEAPTVVLCHHGMRSASVTAFLRQRDFRNVANLAGGIDHWAATVDPSLARY